MLKKDLLWSTFIDEEICKNFYECKQCDEDLCCCHSDSFDVDYDSLHDIIREDLNFRFVDGVSYEYMIVGVDYINYYGLKQNIRGYSDLFENVEEIVDMLLDGAMDIRIYKGKYNRVYIERCHHDGNELYLLCRLNSKGYDYLNKGYDFNRCKYIIKGTFKDFPFFK